MSAICNPYFDEATSKIKYGRLGETHVDLEVYDYSSGSREPINRRDALTAKYCWSVPTPELIEVFASAGPVVSVGSGTGYLESLLVQAGADVIATDAFLGERNTYSHREQWMEVTEMDCAEAAARWADRALLISWPPYNRPMGSSALESYLEAGGHTVLYLGEGWGGCTGDERFHELLWENFEETRKIMLPQWYGLRDYGSIHRKLPCLRSEL